MMMDTPGMADTDDTNTNTGGTDERNAVPDHFDADGHPYET